MFCKNCGKEISDNAVVCPNCGVATENMLQANSAVISGQGKGANGFAIAGLVLGIVGLLGGNYALLIPGLVGLILSIVGMVKSKQYAAPGLAIASLVISVVSFVIWLIIYIAAFGIIFAAIFGAVANPY